MADRFPYENHSTWSATQTQRKAWSEALEKTGLTAVKSRLATSTHSSHSSLAIGTEISMTKGFAEEWVAWKDAEAAKEEAAYRRSQMQWAKAAVWAAVAAAVISAIGVALQFALAK